MCVESLCEEAGREESVVPGKRRIFSLPEKERKEVIFQGDPTHTHFSKRLQISTTLVRGKKPEEAGLKFRVCVRVCVRSVLSVSSVRVRSSPRTWTFVHDRPRILPASAQIHGRGRPVDVDAERTWTPSGRGRPVDADAFADVDVVQRGSNIL
jgi:hypothetical protein